MKRLPRGLSVQFQSKVLSFVLRKNNVVYRLTVLKLLSMFKMDFAEMFTSSLKKDDD